MKKILVILLALALCFVAGCSSATGISVPTPVPRVKDTKYVPTPSAKKIVFAIGGEVSSNLYVGFGGSGSSSVEYEVQLTIENIGEAVTIDEIASRFHAGNTAKGLSVNVTKADGIWQMNPGEQIEKVFTTNGYTEQLLVDASGGKIIFSISFIGAEKVFAGPYYTLLPAFKELSGGKSSELTFSTQKPSAGGATY